MNKLFFIIIAFVICENKSFAEIRLPAIIGSHMVLQQKSDVKLWGWSNPGEQVRIKTDWDTTTYTTFGTNGSKWVVQIETPPAGGPYKITLTGANTIVLEDVMIGELWLCSGQSNMEWSGDQQLPQSLEEAPKSNNNKIRFFYIPKTTADYPQDNCGGSWKVCTPEEMKHFSAIGYFFGKKLQNDLQVPVGLVNSNWGGTPAEVWTPSEVIQKTAVLDSAARKIKEVPYWPNNPGLTYNAMIHPVTNFAIAGVIWYQGESNVETYSTYHQLFTAMIGAWRKAWKKDFPFYFVQIAPFAYGGNIMNGALLRETQTKSLSYPNTGMVVISDLVDDIKNIHPTNKIAVATRLANLALAENYGRKDIVYKSPLYKSMKAEKEGIRIYFENADNGLMSKNGVPTSFFIAGEDHRFLPALARIDGSTVVVSSKAVKNPVAVRFGFLNESIPDLFSKDGLPVNLFRTDDWKP